MKPHNEQLKREVQEAITTIRTTNSTIPDAVIDFMRHSTIKAIEDDEESDARMIMRRINNIAFRPHETAVELAKDHRTLQQSFMALCIKYIEVMAAKDMGMDTDLRNEAAVKLAKKIVAATDEIDRALPYI